MCVDVGAGGAYVFAIEIGTALRKDNIWFRNMQPTLAAKGTGHQGMRSTRGTLTRQLKS